VGKATGKTIHGTMKWQNYCGKTVFGAEGNNGNQGKRKKDKIEEPDVQRNKKRRVPP